MYKIMNLSIALLLVPVFVQSAEINNPMRPPAFALLKYQQIKNKNKPIVATVEQDLVKPEALQLTSILYSSSRKIAIIDDQMLSIGDSISGAKVISIKKDGARLIRQGKTINLSLSNQQKSIRKTTTEKQL